MTDYNQGKIYLNKSQLERLQKHIESEEALGFTKYTDGEFEVPVFLTDGQVKNYGMKPIRFSVKQIRALKKDGGFLGAIAKVLASIGTKLLPALEVAAPALATGALTGAASYGATKALDAATGNKKKGKGLYLHKNSKPIKPYTGGNITIELTPSEVNSLLEPKEGGFLPILASLAAGLLPTLLGSGLSSDEIKKAKKIILKPAMETDEKKAQQKLEELTEKYGQGLLGKLFKLPGNKIPVLGDIPILNMLF